jgi:hypothetical protein
MTSFIEAISQDPHDIKMTKLLAKNPFQNIVLRRGGAAELFRIQCVEVYVQPNSIKKLRKYVKFVPLKEVSAKMSGRAFFTVGCVCEMQGSAVLISDLKSAQHILIAEKCPILKKCDVIAIANAEVGSSLRTYVASQILCIGRCENVGPCSCAESRDMRCSAYVDTSVRASCDFHCSELFSKAGASRALLKQNTRLMTDSPQTSPDRPFSVARKPLVEISAHAIDEYLEYHSNGRAAKFHKALDPKKAPQVGAGFSAGDVIML